MVECDDDFFDTSIEVSGAVNGYVECRSRTRRLGVSNAFYGMNLRYCVGYVSGEKAYSG